MKCEIQKMKSNCDDAHFWREKNWDEMVCENCNLSSKDVNGELKSYILTDLINRISENIDKDTLKIINKFTKDITTLRCDDPLDGDETSNISNIIQLKLDLENGNW